MNYFSQDSLIEIM